MLSRRELLRSGGWLALWPAACAPRGAPRGAGPAAAGELVNDVHSALNPTWVARSARPRSLAELRALVRQVAGEGRSLSVAGGRHSMGGQQFGAGTVLLDTRGLDRILALDAEQGLLEVEAGIEWPTLVEGCRALQAGRERQWGIAQKQTGADRITVGGTLSCNGHGRGLTLAPFVGDLEAVTVLGSGGEPRRLSRVEEPELFRLVVGGYGLFTVVYSATLRLRPRRKLERVVEIRHRDELATLVEDRIAAGFLYGDFQFAIDPRSPDFLARGVFSCYRPVPDDTPLPAGQRELSDEDWRSLLFLAHADKGAAFERYSTYYLSTSGQIYWSDTHQMSPYFDGYHRALDLQLRAPAAASEVISELYVPRPRLADFLAAVGDDLRAHGDEVIYGTVRFIERDAETFLPWARARYACIVFNLHVEHTAAGGARAAAAFRRLIDRARERGGSFYLTYHRHATRDQIEACHPRFREFLEKKLERDPGEFLQSDWWRHHRDLFGVRP